MKKIVSLVAALVSFVACNIELIEQPDYERVNLNAQIEQFVTTKTVLDVNNNIRWTEGDQIMAFMKSSLGVQYQLLPEYAGMTYGSFTDVTEFNGNLNAGMEWDHIVAYYPYSKDVKCVKSNGGYLLEVNIPSTQQYAFESFPEDAFPMVAVNSNANITFKNVCGAIKLPFTGSHKITSIIVEGNNSELLSGPAQVFVAPDALPVITMLPSASNKARLNCKDGVQLDQSQATEFIMTLPPVTFENGFTITVIDENYASCTITATTANDVFRSSILVMPEVNLDDYEWDVPDGPVELDNVIYTLNEGYVPNAICLYLSTGDIEFVPSDMITFDKTFRGNGKVLTVDFYSEDGYLHEGTYTSSAAGDVVNPGEFAIGWNPGDLFNVGFSYENWGTCWWNVDNDVTTVKHVEEGTVTVSRIGEKWLIELVSGGGSDMLWAKFEGEIHEVTKPYTFTETLTQVYDMSTFSPIETLTTHNIAIMDAGTTVATFCLITEVGEDFTGTYLCQEYAQEDGLMINGYDLKDFGIEGVYGSYYYKDGECIYINPGETIEVTRNYDGSYLFVGSTGFSFVAYERSDIEQDGNIQMPETSGWSIVGFFSAYDFPTSGWLISAGAPLYVLDENYFVIYGFELRKGDEFKFLKGDSWGNPEVGACVPIVEPNTIQRKGGTNISDIPEGRYDIYLASDASKFYIMSEGKTPAEATEPAPVEFTYTVTGTIQDALWDNAATIGLMDKEGDYYVAKNIPFIWSSNYKIEFQILETGTQYGFGEPNGVMYGPNTEMHVTNDIELNIVVDAPEGAYDVYLDLVNAKVWFMEPGKKPGE